MANSVTIRTSAPGAKQAAGDMNALKSSVMGLGTKTAGPLGGMLGALGGINPLAIAAGVGIGAVTAALGDGIASALEEDKQLGRLKATLEANVPAWDGSTAAVDRATTQAMDLSFADDAARESMIKLITATGNVEESMRDMSLAMDIARGRNIDLGAATDIVIKANMGNVGALRRLGIEVDKNATSTEILAELTKRYAGQAEQYANTTAGRFESAQVKVNDAMEEFGHHLVNTTAGILGLSDALNGESQATVDYLRSLGAVLPGFTQLADELEKKYAELPDKMRGTLEKTGVDMADVMTESFAHKAELAEDIERTIKSAFGKAFATGEVADDSRRFGADIGESLGSALTDNFADAVRGNKGDVADAMDDLMYAINHPLKLQKELARIEGALTSTNLQEALASKNPLIRTQAEQTKERLEALWLSLKGTAYTAGDEASGNLQDGLNNNYPGAVEDASGLVRHLNGIFGGLKTNYSINVKTGDYRYGGLASGGDLKPGERRWVGEQGRELMEGGMGGAHVYNHSQSEAMARGSVVGGSGAGGVTVNINGPIYGGPAGLDQLARDISSRLRQTSRGAMRGALI